MATPIFTKPNFINGVWANQAGDGIDTPSNEKIALGHVVEKPPFEMVNYIENRQDVGIAYMFQHGISEWESGFTYPTGALVKRSQVVYKALAQSTGADPLLSPAVWEIAFFRNADGVSVSNDVNNIKNTEGFLNLYVSKANPVITGRLDGRGILLNTGTPVTGSENIGLSFKGNTLDGIYHDGSSAVAFNNGLEVVKFVTPTSLTESTKNVVTMDVLMNILASRQGYAVDDIYITLSNVHPATRFGYGTWEKVAQGMTLVGQSDNGSHPNWTRTVGNTFGAYEVNLTIENLPPHNHSSYPFNKFASRAGDFGSGNRTATSFDYTPSEMNISNITVQEWQDATEKTVGSGTAHNNVQPSFVVYIWRRTA